MKTWIFFQNPFMHAARGNFKRAVKISTFTDSALAARQADAFYGPLYLIYHPLHLALLDLYATWFAQGNAQEGATLGVGQLLKLLNSGKVNDWIKQVANVYNEGTTAFMAIFPDGHR